MQIVQRCYFKVFRHLQALYTAHAQLGQVQKLWSGSIYVLYREIIQELHDLVCSSRSVTSGTAPQLSTARQILAIRCRTLLNLFQFVV